ncbi:MAG: hypothetical protein IPM29_05540 [Planctomycetes bacterium]|nr:hypothetical protein [Planctomycetota bacterium]
MSSTALSTALPVVLTIGALAAQEPPQKPPSLDELLQALEPPLTAPTPSVAGASTLGSNRPLLQAGAFSLYDLSFNTLIAVGASTERDSELESLQGSGHDPRKRGFTLRQFEVALAGAVDPYFRAKANLVYFVDPIDGESVFELEEAHATTTCLPYGLEVQAGMFFTEFGRQNPRHPDAWVFLDAPVIHTRVFGPDGIRAPGARLGWLLPTPWFSELYVGVQNANGEQMASFLANADYYGERPIGGRPFTERDPRSLADLVWLARWNHGVELTEDTTLQFGASALFGPNASGGRASTAIFGADVQLRWKEPRGGRQAQELILEAELVHRDYEAAAFVDAGDPSDPGDDIDLPSDTLTDWGVTTHLLYRFAPTWHAGLRFDFATGRGTSYDADGTSIGRAADPFRDDRYRVSPMIGWQVTEFSRLRLQYNFDDADHLGDGGAHSVWFGVDVVLGQHPPHGL